MIKAPMREIDKFICTKGVKASTILSLIKGNFNYNDKYFILLDDELVSTNKESVDNENK